MRSLLAVALGLLGCGASTEPYSPPADAASDVTDVSADASADASTDGPSGCTRLQVCCEKLSIPEYRNYCEETVRNGDSANCAQTEAAYRDAGDCS